MITDHTTSGRTYHHNGDYSGEVHLIMRPDEVDEDADLGGRAFMVAKVPMEDLIDIVAEYVYQKAEYVYQKRVQRLRSAGARTLLDIDL
jgi:hypothetical protein